MPHSAGSSSLIAAIHGIQSVYEDAIWLVWYERGVWERSRSAAAELNVLEKILKECYDVIDLVTLAAIERFGNTFQTQDEDALAVLRAVMAELDASLLGPVQRGPSQRQFRKGSLKPTSHLMCLARSSCQKVVDVLESINETLMRHYSPKLARRRSSSWVPASQEAKKASLTSYPRLRRTSSLQMEIGSMASHYSADFATAIRRPPRKAPLTGSSSAALAKQYSRHGHRKSSLFFTDSINVTSGKNQKHKLSIQITRGGNGPPKYMVSVPEGTTAEIDGQPALNASDRERVTVFHDPFASERAKGSVNITINLKTRRSQYVQAEWPATTGGPRRESKSLPTTPTGSLRPPLLKSPNYDSEPKASRRPKHTRYPTQDEKAVTVDSRVRDSNTTPQFQDYCISPNTRDVMVSPRATPSPHSLGSPAMSGYSLSPGFIATPTIAQALREHKKTNSIITTSSFSTSVMSYMRRDSSRASRAVSMISATNDCIPDLMNIRSAFDPPAPIVSSVHEDGVTTIDDISSVSSLSSDAAGRRRASSLSTVRSNHDVIWQRSVPTNSSLQQQHHRRSSTGTFSPLRTFYDDLSLKSPRLSQYDHFESAMAPLKSFDEADGISGSPSGGVRLSMLSAMQELESRSNTPTPSPFNDYLGFCAGAFWAQAGLAGAMLRRRATRRTSSLSHGSTFLACSNRRCGFTAEDADAEPLIEARGVRMRPRFLVKSHVEQKAGAVSLYRCMLCVLGERAASFVQGADALARHLVDEHAGEAMPDDVLGAAACITGRRAANTEAFDLNLLPPETESASNRHSTLSDSLLAPTAGARGYFDGLEESSGHDGVLGVVSQLRYSRRGTEEITFDD